MLTLFLTVLGFVFLVKGADLLVDGASSLARRLHISNLVIGLTIVAFGTSAPELVVNLYASVSGNTEIAIGNILGSNISNILLILGISAIIYPIAAKRSTVLKEIPLSLLAALLVGVAVNDVFFEGAAHSTLTRIDGLFFLAFFIIFIYYTFGIANIPDAPSEIEIRPYSLGKAGGMILLGFLGLTFGGKWIVDGAVALASYLQISQSLVGLTIVAVGTSLPELATSITAALKKESDIAIGNVVGSNIFNIFLVLGISAVVSPLPFNADSNVDIGVTILASAILFVLMYVGKKHVIERWQGGVLLFSYLGYLGYLILTR